MHYYFGSCLVSLSGVDMARSREETYVGLDADYFGGMTPTGTVIRDAFVFGLLPETETCVGWTYGRIEELYDRVSKAWEPYGNLASLLPEDLRKRHERIFGDAIARARALGWAPELGDDE
jgi:hypothetical protein